MKIKSILTILTALLLLISGINKIINMETYEFVLAENGIFSWYWAPIIIRLITIVECFLGLALLTKTFSTRFSFLLLFILSIFYGIDLISSSDVSLYPNYSLLSIFHKGISLIGFLLLISFLIYNVYKPTHTKSVNKKFNSVVNLLTIIAFSTTTLILNPLFIDDFQVTDSSVSPTRNWEPLLEQVKQNDISIEENEPTFIAFFSTSCYFCNRSSKMLGISQRISTPKQNMLLVFPGNKKDTEEFIERNKCQLPFVRVDKKYFVELAGSSFPKFFMIEGNKETNQWSGRTFNYRVIDSLYK